MRGIYAVVRGGILVCVWMPTRIAYLALTPGNLYLIHATFLGLVNSFTSLFSFRYTVRKQVPHCHDPTRPDSSDWPFRGVLSKKEIVVKTTTDGPTPASARTHSMTYKQKYFLKKVIIPIRRKRRKEKNSQHTHT